MSSLKSVAYRCFAALAIGALGLVASTDSQHRLSLGTEAHATTSVLITLDELVNESTFVVVGQPVERVSRWEQLGKSKRIVTYTRLIIEESMIGKVGKEIWVRTLGGTVDNIGQQVAGEASFTIGKTSVVFLTTAKDDALVVTGMAQGHFPLVDSASDRVLTSSPDTGTLLPRKGAKASNAREDLLGSTLTDARARILKAKKASK